ncbi:MAG: SpoIIE family protein phosphatase [Pseudomonadota bacterium]
MQAKQNVTAQVDLVDRPVALIVDDSRLQRKILTASVARWGFEVLEAATGMEALEACQHVAPDIILSDWMMPGMNGLEFCDAFRRLPHEDYSYFILLTSKSDKDEVAEGLGAGADDYLTKPVNAHELRARIIAGQRILAMQRELRDKNRLITDTLNELQRVYDSVDDDLRQARELQQSLVPERFRQFDQSALSLVLRPSGHVGGDLVGFFEAQPGHLGLFAIDVSGHGISSALLTARLAGYLSAAAPSQNVALQGLADGTYRMRPPAEAIEAINSMVLDEMETQHYFTMLLADVDLTTGAVLIGQAGHPHPVVQRADGSVAHVGEGGFPVGLMDIANFSEFEVQLMPGDRLLFLSDGVVECPGPNGDMLEEEGLTNMLSDLHGSHGLAMLETLLWKLSEFTGEQAFPDDISGVMFEYQLDPKT